MRRIGSVGLVAIAALLLGGCGQGGGQGGGTPQSAPATGSFDAERAWRDLRRQVQLGPRPAGSAANRRLTRLLARELEDGGATGIRIQRPHRNVVAALPGSEPGWIVVGAHHDTPEHPPGVVGANDGASGVALVLELVRSLPRPLPGPSLAVALFDAEEARRGREFGEDGMRGSRQYVRLAGLADASQQGAPPLDEIVAMVLFDMVGDCDLRVPREAHSSERLYALFAEAAGGEPFAGETGPVLDDHVPFLEAGIEAVDLIDFDFGPGQPPGEWWHSTEDTLDKVCPESLAAVGSAALAAIPRIGR